MDYDAPLTPAEVLSQITSSRQPRPALENQSMPARSDLESALASCWAEVLRLDEVGRDDNFFSLGGDSLQMTQIASRMRARHRIELPLNTFLDHPTVAKQAAVLTEASSDDTSNKPKRFITSTDFSAPTANTESSAKPLSPNLPRLPEEGKVLSIGAIVIPTSERPGALRCCLASLLANLRDHRHRARILVADGSRNPKSIKENEEIVREASETAQHEIRLIGVQQRQNLIQRMKEAGIDRDILDFAFTGRDDLGLGSIGATRNLLLFATAGEAFLSLDDDTECLFANAVGSETKVLYKPHETFFDHETTEIWVKPDRQALISSAAFSATDFVRSHQELLGRNTAQLASALESKAQGAAKDLTPLGREPGRILISLNGLIGDCGWGSPSRYLFLGDASFERLTESEQSYRTGVGSREMLRVAPAFTLSRHADNLMTTAFGADGRTLLPPFFPVGRGSDAVFGRLLKRISPTAVFGHLPWAILHQALENRQFWTGEILRSAGSTDLRGMVCDLLAAVPQKELPTEKDAVKYIGQNLADFASQPLSDFHSLLAQQRRLSTAEEIAALESRVQTVPGKNPAVQHDIDAYVRKLKESLEHRTTGIPAELLFGREPKQALTLARELIALYGRLLCFWPEMIESKNAFPFPQ
jgi:aryl carrier-like protein